MKLFICLDKNLGMLYKGKRIASDEAVLFDIKRLCGKEPLFVSPGSEGMFKRTGINVNVTDLPVESAIVSDSNAFIEDPKYIKEIKNIEFLIIYFWEEDYDSDKFFLFDLLDFDIMQRKMIEGKRHKLIQRKIFENTRLKKEKAS